MNIFSRLGNRLDKLMEEILRTVKYKDTDSASGCTECLRHTDVKYLSCPHTHF